MTFLYHSVSPKPQMRILGLKKPNCKTLYLTFTVLAMVFVQSKIFTLCFFVCADGEIRTLKILFLRQADMPILLHRPCVSSTIRTYNLWFVAKRFILLAYGNIWALHTRLELVSTDSQSARLPLA